MFDDLVLVLQERTSEYEDRHGQDKTKSEVCQEKKLHLYAELVFPISLYLFPRISVLFPISLYLFPRISVLFPISLYLAKHVKHKNAVISATYRHSTFHPISLYFSHISGPFTPYPCTFPIFLDLSPHI